MAVSVLALGVSVSKADIEVLLQMIQNPDLLTWLLLLRVPLWRVGPAIGVFNKGLDVTELLRALNLSARWTHPGSSQQMLAHAVCCDSVGLGHGFHLGLF